MNTMLEELAKVVSGITESNAATDKTVKASCVHATAPDALALHLKALEQAMGEYDAIDLPASMFQLCR